MRVAAVLFVLTAAVIGGVWAWLGQPVAMPGALGDTGKLYCVSYAPFRGSQSPLDPATRIEPFQIEEDIAQLAKLTGCVRT